jgi:glycosyltransferase involved in cell wall biosynthesis
LEISLLRPSRSLDSHPTDQDSLSVGFVCPAWPVESFSNGVVSYTATTSAALRGLGHQATVLTGRHSPPAGGPADPGPGVHLLAPPRGLARLALLPFWRLNHKAAIDRSHCGSIREAARQLAIDPGLDILEMEECFGWPRLVSGRVSPPVVVRLHGPGGLVGPATGAPDDKNLRRRVRLEGLGLASAAGITAPSSFVLDWARRRYGLEPSHAEVIPNPAPPTQEADRWRADRHDPGLILFIGRFDHLKGVDLAIEAFRMIRDDYPAARLRLIGPCHGEFAPGSGSASPEQYLDEHLPGDRASGRVEWLGPVPHGALVGHRREARACVVASRFETFPMAVLEATALGCPVIASEVGGIPEVIRDGHNGLLFPMGDAAALAAQLRRILDGPDLAARLGSTAAEDCAERFDATRLAARTAEFYHRVLRSYRPPARHHHQATHA